MTDPLLLLSETSSGGWAADRIEGVPVVAPVTIVLTAGSPGMEAEADRLRTEILNILSSSGPEVRVAPPADPDPSLWPGCADPDRLKILILVCSAADPAVDREWFQAWLQDAPDRSALPLFKVGADPSALMLSPDLKKLNASFWKIAPSECVPAIFSRVGLTVSEQRVFISYRRIETQPLAEQLFDALTHDGFDVFVDRFSVEPGVDFQRRLDQELADKSMRCPKSLARMRESMLAKTDPDMMMAIGGMDGVLLEAELFTGFARKTYDGRPKPIYVVGTTGGAAEQLADGSYRLADGPGIHRLEEEWESSSNVRPALERADREAHGERRFIPYAVMMQWLVEHLAATWDAR